MKAIKNAKPGPAPAFFGWWQNCGSAITFFCCFLVNSWFR